MKRRAGSIIMGVLVFLGLVFAVSAVDATVVKVDPPSQTVRSGDEFSVNVTVEDVTYMAADQVTLNFDPSAMQATVIVEGDFLKSAGTTLGAGFETIDNNIGFVTFAYTLMTPGVGVNGSGTLATVNFNTDPSAAAGVYNLNLTDVLLADGDGNTMTVDAISNGTVTISTLTPPTPTPTATSPPNGGGAGGGGDARTLYTPTPTLIPTLSPTPTPSPSPTPTPTPSPTPSLTPTSTLTPTPKPEGVQGFEALFAILGLLAVAYLLKRRK